MDFLSLINKLSDRKIVVVGDLMLDHYIWGDVHRISPEAPVPVVYATRDTYTAGGAANVALNLANLGVSTTLLGQYSDDDAGKRLKIILDEKGVVVPGVLRHSLAPTIIKTRVIARSQQLCRIDREGTREEYSIENTPGFDNDLRNILSKADAVIISDYAKGVITQSLLDKILQISREEKPLLISVDPKPSRHLNFKGAGLITPNRLEALELAGISDMHPGEKYPLEEVCRKIHALHSPLNLVITLGAEGMAVCKNGEIIELLPTEAREVFDVSGAGDTVIATLTAAIAGGADLIEAARFANAAAGCVIAHMGTAPINKEELISWGNKD